MPNTTSTSTQVCRDFIYRRCKRERNGGCPYKHDPTLQNTATDKKMATSRTKLQDGYANGTIVSTAQPKVLSKLCIAFFENRCKRPHCKQIHNGYLALDYVDRAKSLILGVLDALRQSGSIEIADDAAHCYFYNTGADCIRNVGSARCPFTHTLALRRAVVKVLDGKSLSAVLVAESAGAGKLMSRKS